MHRDIRNDGCVPQLPRYLRGWNPNDARGPSRDKGRTKGREGSGRERDGSEVTAACRTGPECEEKTDKSVRIGANEWDVYGSVDGTSEPQSDIFLIWSQVI